MNKFNLKSLKSTEKLNLNSAIQFICSATKFFYFTFSAKFRAHMLALKPSPFKQMLTITY